MWFMQIRNMWFCDGKYNDLFPWWCAPKRGSFSFALIVCVCLCLTRCHSSHWSWFSLAAIQSRIHWAIELVRSCSHLNSHLSLDWLSSSNIFFFAADAAAATRSFLVSHKCGGIPWINRWNGNQAAEASANHKHSHTIHTHTHTHIHRNEEKKKTK